MKDLLQPGDRVIDFQWTNDSRIPDYLRTIRTTGTVTQVNPLRIKFDPTPGHEDVGDLDWHPWRKDVCTSVIGHIGNPCEYCGWETTKSKDSQRVQEVS